jgi:hypothetical protein
VADEPKLEKDPALEALEQRVLEQWDDDARHARLVSYAQQSRCLGELAGFYKQASMVEGSPYRLNGAQIEDARKRLGGVAMLAMMDLDAAKTTETTSPALQAVRVVAALFLFVTVGLLLYMLTKR